MSSVPILPLVVRAEALVVAIDVPAELDDLRDDGGFVHREIYGKIDAVREVQGDVQPSVLVAVR